MRSMSIFLHAILYKEHLINNRNLLKIKNYIFTIHLFFTLFMEWALYFISINFNSGCWRKVNEQTLVCHLIMSFVALETSCYFTGMNNKTTFLCAYNFIFRRQLFFFYTSCSWILGASCRAICENWCEAFNCFRLTDSWLKSNFSMTAWSHDFLAQWKPNIQIILGHYLSITLGGTLTVRIF